MKGFALLEVLVTLLVISLGILGIMAMQLTSLHATQSAYIHSLASSQLDSMMERLRANLTSDARDKELVIWRNLIGEFLPQGVGNYSCIDSSCTVEISWFDKKSQQLQLTSVLRDDHE